MTRAIARSLCMALMLGAGAAVAATTVDRAFRDAATGPTSLDHEKGLYATLRFFDPSVKDDRDLVDGAIFRAGDIERAAILRGLCDRAPAGGAVDKTTTGWIEAGLDSLDVGVRTAAVECLERLPAAKAAEFRVEQLEDVRGRGLSPVLVRTILASVSRHPDRRVAEVLEAYSRSELRDRAEINTLTPDGAFLLLAMAANGTDVEPMFSTILKDASGTDFPLRARINAIRARRGDEKALADLVETANVAVDKFLRREAIDLILAMPAEPRAKAMSLLASRVDDFDPQIRARVVRELSREAASGDATAEKMLVSAAADVFPDLRVQAIAGLHDRAAAGTLSPEALGAARTLSRSERDPLAAAALRAFFARAEAHAPAPPSTSPPEK